jgi:hypothetical protein
MMKAIRFSETSILISSTRRNIPEDGIVKVNGSTSFREMRHRLRCLRHRDQLRRNMEVKLLVIVLLTFAALTGDRKREACGFYKHYKERVS